MTKHDKSGGIEIPGHTEEASQRKAAKVAGLMFLFIVIGWTLNWTLIDSKLIVAGNVTATVNNIMANELLFRIGITNQLIFSISGVVLALALYIILKPVNKNLALLALFLKLTEAILGAVIALGSFIALLILNGQASLTAFEQEYIQALVGLFLNGRISISAIPMVFLGLNLMVFFYLLLKSKYIPGILASFGILSYALIFMYALITILSPNYAAIMIIQIISWAPSVIFELIIGLWLLIKGVNVEQRDIINE
ncbi:MAG: DUF4386 domain-containing protein [Candidatus Methanoperedens sp.]|nr:DUF4386 domain-containing protein [Candidatus Methanoperedens sp.]